MKIEHLIESISAKNAIHGKKLRKTLPHSRKTKIT